VEVAPPPPPPPLLLLPLPPPQSPALMGLQSRPFLTSSYSQSYTGIILKIGEVIGGALM